MELDILYKEGYSYAKNSYEKIIEHNNINISILIISMFQFNHNKSYEGFLV